MKRQEDPSAGKIILTGLSPWFVPLGFQVGYRLPLFCAEMRGSFYFHGREEQAVFCGWILCFLILVLLIVLAILELQETGTLFAVAMVNLVCFALFTMYICGCFRGGERTVPEDAMFSFHPVFSPGNSPGGNAESSEPSPASSSRRRMVVESRDSSPSGPERSRAAADDLRRSLDLNEQMAEETTVVGRPIAGTPKARVLR